MYQLYYFTGACSLATQVVLRELDQEFTIIDKQRLDDFTAINPVGSVPVLMDGDKVLTEGAAIMLYLLNKHKNALLPENADEHHQAVQNIMFANATMHPAYSKLFFIGENIVDESIKHDAFNAVAKNINHLWQVVENQLSDKKFLGGNNPSAADIMLAVYSAWGAYFPVDIVVGQRTKAMLTAVRSMPNFALSVQAEQMTSAA